MQWPNMIFTKVTKATRKIVKNKKGFLDSVVEAKEGHGIKKGRKEYRRIATKIEIQKKRPMQRKISHHVNQGH